ncbi:MAG: hypothetical protein J6S31_01070 [Lachnospiraceae bacterium]|nr:hypothetical protein [Lachnospiraceae bacterium]
MKVLRKLVSVLLLAVLSVIVCLPVASYAAGGAYVSETQIDIAVGETVSIAVGADNAAGSYSVSSYGSVMANGSDFLDNDFKAVSIYGASEGYGEVYITLDDFATYDEEDLSGSVITVYVNVYAPDGGYTGDYGKSGELPDYNYDDVTQVSDVLNLWLNDEPYSVLTDLSGVEKPKGFTEADGTFEGEKVKTLNYGSEIVLYALWNHWTGDVILRTYDPATQTFGEPATFKQGNNTYYLLKIPNGTEIPEGYTKKELDLNGNKVEALLCDKQGYEDFYYIYVLNDGQSGFYSYDKKEGTLQRTVELKPAQEEEAQPEKAEAKKSSIFSKKIFLIALGVAAVIIIVLIILLAVTRKKYKDLTEDDY